MWIDDTVLAQCEQPLTLAVWCPASPLVVLGSSNQLASECYPEACRADSVPILRRYGGGGAVVLHPGCVILSLGAWVREPYQNTKYFRAINAALTAVLSAAWPSLAACEQQGISDLCLAGKKIAGTSLFRSRNYLLYQASLLVENRVELFERYLPHPSLEPAYRQRKSHRAFVGALADTLPGLSCEALRLHLQANFLSSLQEHLAGELINPIPAHVAHLHKRAAEADAALETTAKELRANSDELANTRAYTVEKAH